MPTRLLILLFAFVLLNGCREKKAPAENPAGVPNGKEQVLPGRPRPSASLVPVDVSPMDMSYFPADYPKLNTTGNLRTPPLARVIYSRPHLEGRHIFRDVLQYGEPWRLGANEATELQFFSDATIQQKKIPAGRYILYCIPQPEIWTLVLNSHTDSWGLQPDSTRDLARFTIPVTRGNPPAEFFSMLFEKTETGADLLMAWDDAQARLPIRF